MMTSLLKQAGLDLPVPNYSTLSGRQKTVTIQIACHRSGSLLHLLLDSTAVKMLGEG